MNIPFRYAVLAAVFSGHIAVGAADFVVDSSASILSVSGTFRNVSILEQTPGSLSVGYHGILVADPAGGLLTLQASGPSSLFQSSPQLPLHGSENTLSALGFRIPLGGGGNAFFAIDSLSLYLSTEFRPPLDVADGAFAPADVSFFIEGGTLVGDTGGSDLFWADLHGIGAPNRATGAGSFSSSGNTQTLTIPVATTVTFSVDAPDDLELTFSGQIVATNVVPEPAAAAFLCLATVGFSYRRARRHS